MALKWVYDHIGGFGGDNKKITLSGYSAGNGNLKISAALVINVIKSIREI